MAIKYDNCKDCHSRCIHAGKDRDFICMNGVSCKIEKAKPKTNADRIRAMSDEELANLLTDFSNNGGWVTETGREICYERHIDWLKQPAE